jgi:hypothetical protein
MSDGPLTESGPETYPEDRRETRPTSSRFWESPRFVAFTALAIALIAVAAAIAAWLVPRPHHFSGDQSAQAKTKVCTTYATVRNAVSQGTFNPRPGDPVSQTAVAANVRLAIIGGSAYLKDTLAAAPATPSDVAKAVDSMANTLNEMGFAYLLKQDERANGPMLQTLNKDIAQINQMCAPKKK